MSLINQVLQDLDRRHAAVPAGPAPGLRAAPARRADRWPIALATFGAALAAGIAAAMATGAWPPSALRQALAAPLGELARDAPVVPAPTRPPTVALVADVPATFAAAALPGGANAATVVDFAAVAGAARPGREDAPIAPASARSAEIATAASAHANATSTATAAAAGATAPVSAPAPAPAAAQVAALAPAAAPAPTPVAPTRVEKSTPPLSAGERADAEYRRGVELHEEARGVDAEAAFSAALQLDGRHASARQALAVAWLGRGRTADAERLLAEGLARDPLQPRLALVLARVHAERQDLRAGVETLRASLGAGAATTAEQAEARALMATLQQSAGQHREAADGFAAALRATPQHGPWWVGLGLSLAAEGRAESARQAFERARATGSLSPELLAYVGQRLRTTSP